MSQPGSATTDGTGRFRNRVTCAKGHFRIQQQLWLSSIGIGTYLGDADDETDAKYLEAIVRAVELGVNVIDSAANYRFQRSERSIGRALKALSRDKGISREELVICTKGGYLPFDGAPPRDVRRYIEESFVRPGIVKFEDFVGGSHCMTPAYLENQLDQSLRNLDLETIDVYYIHNPESQLGFVSETEFYSRLRIAFEFLEKARAANRIRWYGVATWNGFRVQQDSRQYHSLARMVDVAADIGGQDHGFKFVQVPFNLGMPEALTVQSQLINGEELSTIEAGRALDVTLICSASILQGRFTQGLPETIREPLGSLPTDAQTAIQFVRSTPGITTALVGMSNKKHVEENLKLVAVEPSSTEDFLRLFSDA